VVLYSTTTYLKYRTQETYRGEHHVWCSPAFEAAKLSKYAIGANAPPSSDPVTIYRSLFRAVRDTDEHDDKIASQKKVVMALAVQWHADGHVTEAQRDEIIAVVTQARFNEWKPLVFVIPYVPVAGRVQLVPRGRRASSEPEYIIPDLKSGEFDIIEPATWS